MSNLEKTALAAVAGLCVAMMFIALFGLTSATPTERSIAACLSAIAAAVAWRGSFD